MPPVVYSTTSLVELEKFMAETLCSQERLDIQQTHIKRTLIRQGLHVIGLSVSVQGPRLMRSQAIWAEQENRILFYDSAGKRFAVVKLAESPVLEAATAA